jgi:hypothetical protein
MYCVVAGCSIGKTDSKSGPRHVVIAERDFGVETFGAHAAGIAEGHQGVTKDAGRPAKEGAFDLAPGTERKAEAVIGDDVAVGGLEGGLHRIAQVVYE